MTESKEMLQLHHYLAVLSNYPNNTSNKVNTNIKLKKRKCSLRTKSLKSYKREKNLRFVIKLRR